MKQKKTDSVLNQEANCDLSYDMQSFQEDQFC